MINKIDLLQNIGGFPLFEWAPDVPLFSKVNLIFGDNGSGKTTLSNALRLFSTEPGTDKIFCELESGPSPTVEATLGGKQVTYSPEFPGESIYVFNADFVAEHVFDGSTPRYRRFDASVVTQQQLSSSGLKELTKKIDNLREQSKGNEEARSKLESHFQHVRERYGDELNTRVPHTNMPQVQLDGTAPSQPLDRADARLEELYAEHARSRERTHVTAGRAASEALAFRSIKFDLGQVYHILGWSVRGVARRKVQGKIDALSACKLRHGNLSEWMEDGYLLLTDLASKDRKVCPLCGSDVADSISGLLEDYEAFFSEEYDRFVTEITQLLDDIRESRLSAKTNIETRRRMQEVEQLYSAYLGTGTGAGDVRDAADAGGVSTSLRLPDLADLLESIEARLCEKKDSPARTIWDPLPDGQTLIHTYNDAVQGLQERKRRITQQLSSGLRDPEIVKNDIRRQIPICTSARFDAGGSGEQIRTYNGIASELRSVEKQIQRLETEKREEAAKLRDETLYMNRYLKKLGIDHFTVEEDAQQQILVRFKDGLVKSQLRYSLSESEKTTLALAYFLSKVRCEVLDSVPPKARDTVLVIDDPVSSLDENRLHSTALLIWRMFESCGQLLIFSHNLLFLRFMSNVVGDAGGKDAQGNPRRRDYYLPRRATGLQKLPKELQNYQTTYFRRLRDLHRFNEGEIEYEDAKKFIPNCIRIVLETFLSFKLFVLKGKNKHFAAGLGNLIGRLRSHAGWFSDFQSVNDVDASSLIEKLESARRVTDPQCHGTPQHIDNVCFIKEDELQAVARDSVNAMRFLDRIHVDQVLGQVDRPEQ